jgi:hypothetical protein
MAGRMPIVVTLVHGTWGRGFFPCDEGKPPRWFQQGSAFRKKVAPLFRWIRGLAFGRVLEVTPRWFECGSAFRNNLTEHLESAGVNPTYTDFRWTGSNSLMERDKAAVLLAKSLQNHAGHKRLVIAHSHGGNVAMRALHHLYLKEWEPLLVVTMATPFIQMFLQYPESSANRTYEAVALLATLGAVSWSLLVLASHVGKFIGEGWAMALGVLLSLISIYLIPNLLLGGSWPREGRRKRVSDLFLKSMIPPGKVAPHKLLVLRGIEDEAGLSLVTGAFGARLSYLFATLGVRLLPWWRPVSFVTLLVGSATFYFNGIPGVIAMIFNSFVTALSLITGGSLLCVLCKCVHGRELVSGGLVCETGSSSMPDSLVHKLTVVTLPVQMERKLIFRHGLYDNVFCCQAIEDWLRFALVDSEQSQADLKLLVDFLNEKPVAGLGAYSEVTAKVLGLLEEQGEAAAQALAAIGTDEELKQELAESEEYLKNLLASLQTQKASQKNESP